MKLVLSAMLIASLAACSSMPIPIGLPCSVGPIIGDAGASKRWSRSEKEQISVLNGTGEKLCGWKPVK